MELFLRARPRRNHRAKSQHGNTHIYISFSRSMSQSNGCNSESVTMWFQDQHRQLKKNATSDIRARAYIHTRTQTTWHFTSFTIKMLHCSQRSLFFFSLLRYNWGVLSCRASIFSLWLHQSAIASWMKYFISKINCIFQLLWLSWMPEIESNLALTR